MKNRIINFKLAIDTIRQHIEDFDLPYKEIGYENVDYTKNNPRTEYPMCYTFRFHSVNYIHIIINEEKYVVEDALHFDEEDYWKIFTDIKDLKMWLSKMSVEYKEYDI